MTDQKEAKLGWFEGTRERKRLKRERMGDSPEKLAERHTPAETVVDTMVRLGGVERESRFSTTSHSEPRDEFSAAPRSIRYD